MAGEQILVVEDEEDVRELIVYHLERDGYGVRAVATGEDALQALKSGAAVDLVLLDLMLPGMSGLDVCRRLRAGDGPGVPVLMVTARGEEADVVAGLELGADDYVAKPFRPRELLARVRAVLRRQRQPVTAQDAVTALHGIEIHPGRREVRVDGQLVDLTYTEFEVLRVLAARPGWVFTRYQIVDAVRGSDYPVTDRSVDVQLVGLRRKLGAAADCIETVRGIGYRFKDEE